MNFKRLILPLAVVGILVLCTFVLWNRSSAARSEQKETTLPGDATGEAKGIKWLTMEEAYNLNKKEPRKTFVDVYTDWCGWCKRMDATTFSDSAVSEYANKNYYAVKLNAESPRELTIGDVKLTEATIARQFGVRSYPTIVFIEKDFKTITPVSGYRQAADFLTLLQQVKDGTTQK
ncbi:MAG: thioredoxin fold domain-containing protein [Bacteroidota bacterium]|nr:thioredoxin fold domain-containing protein [Bacteroidota bacterium]